MVAILEQNKKPSFLQRLNVGVGHGLNAGSQLLDAYRKEQQFHEENQSAKQLGIDLTGIRDPKMRQEAFAYTIENKNKQQKSFQDQISEDKRYQTIKDQFGEEYADLYRAAPEGGKTEILKQLMQMQQREGDLNSQLGITPNPELSNEKSKDAIKTIDYDKGLTPKERVKRQDDRYAKNLPLYEESINKRRSLDAQGEGLSILSELSPQISGFERLNINPMNGELLIPAAASAEAQRFVKTVNDFTTTAKDSYGARVSNFELDRFMKRLPTLANSEEGRRQIIRQMQIINDINLAYEKNLQEVIEEHGGIRNIDYDKAQQLAEKNAKTEISSLKKEFKNIDRDLDKQIEDRIENDFKKNSPKNKITVRMNDGSIGYIDKDKVVDFLKDKAGEVL